MFPEGSVTGPAPLQLPDGTVGCFRKGRIFLGAGAGRRVNFLQLRDGEGGLFRIATGFGFVKIREIRLPLLKFRDDETDGQAPVAMWMSPMTRLPK